MPVKKSVGTPAVVTIEVHVNADAVDGDAARKILARLGQLERNLMAQTDQLRAAVAGVSESTTELRTALDSAVTRVAAKLEELGEPDPDLTAELEALQSAAAQLDEATTVLAGVTPEATLPEPIEVPEPPAEPPTEPPAEPPAEPPTDAGTETEQPA